MNNLIDFFALPFAMTDLKEEVRTYYKDTDQNFIGAVLYYHLRIEIAVNRLLKDNFSNVHDFTLVEKMRFLQKLALLPKQGTQAFILPTYFHYEQVIPACKELNSIRNKLAHNIFYQPKEKDIIAINKHLKNWTHKRRIPKNETPKEKIIRFCEMAELILLLGTEDFRKDLEKNRKDLLNGLDSTMNK